MENIIECKNLTHYYGKRLIYEDLSFSVPRGRIVGLLGKNGTGKTTTINILSGYLQQHSGECYMFGEEVRSLNPELRKRIAILIEGHIQYQFMNIEQIEKFYSKFYDNWNRDAYYGLMSKIKIAPRQIISRMSCGQRSQVALGLIMAQSPDLLILDDFSLGLDPGYRSLFVDYLRDYARSEDKTVFLTSHIIQDMERLIDDCMIMDYGKLLMQKPVKELLDEARRYTFDVPAGFEMESSEEFYHPLEIRGVMEALSFLKEDEARSRLTALGVPYSNLSSSTVDLEEAFIGLSGKY